MNIGIIVPGFSADETDWAIPVQLNLVRELARHDNVRVLALRYPHRRAVYTVAGATVYSLGAGAWTRGLQRLLLWRRALSALHTMHRERPFDVLHAMWADECGLLAVCAGRRLAVPVAASVAGGELAGFPDLRYGLQLSRFSRWTVGRALRADRVIVACCYAHDLITRAGYAVPAEKIRTIPLGVDAEVFRPADEPRDPLRLIHAASLVGVKDQGTLLRAVARLEGLTLDIAGEGPERSKLETLAAGLGIADRVHFLGGVPYQAMPGYYWRAALHVLSSRHEGQGMVTLEAAACGTPTAGTAVGLLPDDPALGLAVPVGDDAALAEAIAGLLADEMRLESLRIAAHDAVQARYTVQHTVEQLRALYAEIR